MYFHESNKLEFHEKIAQDLIKKEALKNKTM